MSENKIYGYVRISTKKQSIERQIRNILREYPDAIIYEEIYTGTSMNRREWNRLLNRVRQKDTIVFDSVSRMSRDAEEGFGLYKTLYNNNIELIFLKEPHINTTTYKKALSQNIKPTGTTIDYILDGINKYLMALAEEQIRLAFEQSEKEVRDLQQRTKEGIETARMNGKQIGLTTGTKLTTKKSVSAKETIQKHSKDFEGTLSDSDVMKLADVSRNSYYKYKRELKDELIELLMQEDE